MLSSSLFASVALSLASVARAVPYFVNGTTGVSPDIFQTFQHAASLSLSAFPPCPEPNGFPKVYEMRGSGTGYVSVDDKMKYINVVMRGSMQFRDFEQDIQDGLVKYDLVGSKGCVGCEIHFGLNASVAPIIDGAVDAVTKQVALHPDYKIFVTGHSLGGSTSQLMALAMVEKFGKEKVRNVALGAFRVGDPKFAAFQNKQFLPETFVRLTNMNDGVPRIPPRSMGFLHGGEEYWIFNNQAGPTTIKRCAGAEDPTCVQQYGEAGWPVNLAHVHYIINFVAPKCLAGDGQTPPLPADMDAVFTAARDAALKRGSKY